MITTAAHEIFWGANFYTGVKWSGYYGYYEGLNSVLDNLNGEVMLTIETTFNNSEWLDNKTGYLAEAMSTIENIATSYGNV